MRDLKLMVRAEAALMLTVVSLGLRCLPYRTLVWLLGQSSSRRVLDGSSIEQVNRVTNAVSVVSRRLHGTTCLTDALAADAMLRRRGHYTDLRLGVRHSDGHPHVLVGHAWLEHSGIVVLGALDDLAEYVVMSSGVEARSMRDGY